MPAANLLDRQFTATAPNRRWVGDTTEFVIGESGKLYSIPFSTSNLSKGNTATRVAGSGTSIRALNSSTDGSCGSDAGSFTR